MSTGFPATTGDILTAAMFNGLVTFQDTFTEQTADYTAVLADAYQKVIFMNKATAIAVQIPN